MKKKVSKLMFVFVVPILACLSLGVFLAGGLVSGYASALAQNGGSAYVRTGSTMSVGDETAISDFSAVNGGGVYVTSGGTLTMSGGTIAGNTATSGSGHNVYNAGTFTMSGGTVGKSGNAKTYGIYNTGTMKLLGGTVYDDIYSSSTFTTSPSATLNGTIALSNSATITVQNYAGTTPILKISLSSSRTDGTIVKFQGSTTQPSLSRLTVSGFDSATYELDIVQGSSSTEWNVVLKKQAVDFPRDWKTQIASTTYMTTTVDDPKTLTSITFEVTVPSGYTQIGTLSTGLKVYQSSSDVTKIAFVNRGKIYAPVDSSEMFSVLSSLTTLTFNNFNTSNVTSMNWMFSVQEVKNIDLSCFDTSKVEDFSFFFHECSILETITLGENFNTSSATNMECMFSYCPKLQSLDVRGFDTSKVTNMRNMFAGLNIVQGLDVSGFNTSKVTDMGGMFSGCSGLTSLNVGNFNTANVTTMGSMFSGCSGLTSLDVSGFDTSKVIYMYSMFSGCSSLISLNLSNFNTSNVTDMYYMFYNCSSLTSLNLSNFNTANVTDMEAMFRGCTGLTSLNLSNFNTANVTDMEAMFYNCSSLTSLDLSRFDTSKVVIENYETSYFPFYGMFENCSSLKSLNVDNFNTLGMKCMDKMFKNCSSLTSLNLSSFDMTNVTSCTDMLNFGTSAVLKHLKTPYNNSVALPITKGNALYDVSTGDPVSSVPANLTSSKTYATRFTITFDANGGSCSESSRTAYYGVDVGDLPTPTRSGYTFDGWFNGAVEVTTSTALYSDTTLTASWTSTSSGGGGSGGGGSGGGSYDPDGEFAGNILYNGMNGDEVEPAEEFMNGEGYGELSQFFDPEYTNDVVEYLPLEYLPDDLESLAFISPFRSQLQAAADDGYNQTYMDYLDRQIEILGEALYEFTSCNGNTWRLCKVAYLREDDVRFGLSENYAFISEYSTMILDPYRDFNATFLREYENLQVIDVSGINTRYHREFSWRIPTSVQAVIYADEAVFNSDSTLSHQGVYFISDYGHEFDVYYGHELKYSGENGVVGLYDPCEFSLANALYYAFGETIPGMDLFIFFSIASPEMYEDYVPLYGVPYNGAFVTQFRRRNDRFGLSVSDESRIFGIMGYTGFYLNSTDLDWMRSLMCLDMRGLIFSTDMIVNWRDFVNPDGGYLPEIIIRSQFEPTEDHYPDYWPTSEYSALYECYQEFGYPYEIYDYDGNATSFMLSPRGSDVDSGFEINQELQVILDDEKRRYFATKQEDLADDSDSGEQEN